VRTSAIAVRISLRTDLTFEHLLFVDGTYGRRQMCSRSFEPVMSVAEARKHLQPACLLAQGLATTLAEAQTAITTQGYRPATV
jgi:hypothetical protein